MEIWRYQYEDQLPYKLKKEVAEEHNLVVDHNLLSLSGNQT